MKAISAWFLGCSLLASSVVVRGASPPPNDNFTNRTLLVGYSNTFTANLAGATREAWEINSFCGVQSLGTVWWSWTAAETSLVILKALEVSNSNASYPSETNTHRQIDYIFLIPSYYVLPTSLTFTSAPGATYWFQFVGNSNTFGKFSLIATNGPMIVQQPKSLTVSTNASALLTVMAEGVLPLAYQWRFNGTDLPGETSSMLAQTNVTAEQAGPYSVLVSNATGMATSEVAHLYVDAVESGPILVALQSSISNTLAFSINGETGRYNRIQSSTNLTQWSDEKVFPLGFSVFDPALPFFTSLVFTTNGSASISIPANNDRKFVRTSRYFPSNEICNLNLKQLRFAKDLWAVEHRKSGIDTPTDMDLAPYFNYQRGDFLRALRCPLGGWNTVDDVQRLPSCTNLGHILEEPR